MILVTNQHVESIIAYDEVIKPAPACSADYAHSYCLTWEAVRVLKERGRAGNYENYAYLEGDIAIPASTFSFWRLNVDAFHRKGFLLTTHRVHQWANVDVLTDCFSGFGPCGRAFIVNPANQTCSEDFVYIKPKNPYSACFLMSKEQFAEYIDGAQSDFKTAHDLHDRPLAFNDKAFPEIRADGLPLWHWNRREMAASGLIWDFRYGSSAVLTHVQLRVHHLSGSAAGHNSSMLQKAAEFDALCPTCRCPSLH